MQVSEKRAVLAQSVASIFNAVFSRLWINRSYLTDNTQPTTLSIFLTATFTLTVKPFSLGPYCTFFFLFFQFLTVTHFWMNNILKLKKQTNWRWGFFLSFFILCISCMLMFCACFCKDWMRYCNILTTIALDSYTSQLSINMLKEE